MDIQFYTGEVMGRKIGKRLYVIIRKASELRAEFKVHLNFAHSSVLFLFHPP